MMWPRFDGLASFHHEVLSRRDGSPDDNDCDYRTIHRLILSDDSVSVAEGSIRLPPLTK